MSERAPDFAAWFALDGECVELVPLKRGHIHDTFVGTWRTRAGVRRVVHQQVNTHVFRDPALLMRNWVRVTEHVRAALVRAGTPDLERRVLRAIPTRSGAPFHTAEDGTVWRAFAFIEGAREQGADVVDYGMLATDMMYFGVARDGLDGGAQITASHNPKEYNGIKMVRQEAFPLSGEAGLTEIREMITGGTLPPPGKASDKSRSASMLSR